MALPVAPPAARPRALLFVTLASVLLGCAAQNQQEWLASTPRALEGHFHLPAGSVTVDTLTEPRDTMAVAGDPSAYIIVRFSAAGKQVDTLHDPRRLDWRPDLHIVFAHPAIERLGYLEGRVDSFDPFVEYAWTRIPRRVALRYAYIHFVCYDEGCDGRQYLADSLDLQSPRRP